MFIVVIAHEAAETALDTIVERLYAAYPKSHQFSPRIHLIAADVTTGIVAEKIGLPMRKDQSDLTVEGAHAVIFKLNGAYAGYASRDLWEWLEAHRGELHA